MAHDEREARGQRHRPHDDGEQVGRQRRPAARPMARREEAGKADDQHCAQDRRKIGRQGFRMQARVEASREGDEGVRLRPYRANGADRSCR